MLKVKTGKCWACVVLLTGMERVPEDQVLYINTYKNIRHVTATGRDDLREIGHRL